MAFYADEEEVWKCPQHPSRRRSIGVCPSCLRDKLSALCPDCANVRPCGCSSSSSSVSYISLPGDVLNSTTTSGLGSVGRVSNLIEYEPSFRRSRSVALFPLLKSARFSTAGEPIDQTDPESSTSASKRSKSQSFWPFFWPHRPRREKPTAEEGAGVMKMSRSRSVSVAASGGGRGEEMRSGKSKGWFFPSPMKVFRHSKTSAKIVQERSPLHRG